MFYFNETFDHNISCLLVFLKLFPTNNFSAIAVTLASYHLNAEIEFLTLLLELGCYNDCTHYFLNNNLLYNAHQSSAK